MTRVGFLDRVDRQRPDRVDRRARRGILSSGQSILLAADLITRSHEEPRSRRGSARRGARPREFRDSGMIENPPERASPTAVNDRRTIAAARERPQAPRMVRPRSFGGRGLVPRVARRPTGWADSRAARPRAPRTRRYHGWYVPAIPPPRRRWMMVSGCEEFATVRGNDHGISTQVYRDANVAGRLRRPVAIPPRALPDLAPRDRASSRSNARSASSANGP